MRRTASPPQAASLPHRELPEQLRRQLRQVVSPVAPHVAFFRRYERMPNAVLFECLMKLLRAGEQAVRLAASDIQHLQLLVGGGGIGQQILIFLFEILPARPAAEDST